MSPFIELFVEMHGSFRAARICGVSVQTLARWRKLGRLPRTEYSGETDYARRMVAHSAGMLKRRDLLPNLSARKTKR